MINRKGITENCESEQKEEQKKLKKEGFKRI